ncbi:hypothetical protein T4E_7098 [Trichinella pseudospiralis]|uniref:Uncharacterized protein n=1 Tax=Trichinella pseudospiralis TaxID=6337 RepID=A0A0V0YJZ4_TRIPS|nr:hypothetical protein T4E_7098 [Trichinella pseudospiralis]
MQFEKKLNRIFNILNILQNHLCAISAKYRNFIFLLLFSDEKSLLRNINFSNYSATIEMHS